MDCARFVEENGTLENQMAALSLSLYLSLEVKERREENLSYTPPLIHGIHGTASPRPVYTGQKSLDYRLPTVRRRSSKVRDKRISRANAPLTFSADKPSTLVHGFYFILVNEEH